MTIKMFEWPEDRSAELTVQSVVGINLDEIEQDERDRQLGLARAEALAAQASAGIALLRDIAAAMLKHKETDAPLTFSTEHLDAVSRTLVSEVLGRGEVSGQVSEPAPMQIQESVYPGLWRVKSAMRADAPECLIIADIPPLLRFHAHKSIDPTMRINKEREGVMNALPVLAEIRDHVKGYVSGGSNHVINFTLLPMSEADMGLMRETLGAGHVDMVSKGYGKCRVCSTRWPNVWSVQFFNAMDTIILDSLEVGDVPVSVRAAGDDFVDSGARILEVIEAYL